jgi:DNA polymerase III delta prime subunit
MNGQRHSPSTEIPREVRTPSGKMITLNDQQYDALTKMVAWGKDPTKRTFTLSGFAGTGKTTIVYVFLNYFRGPVAVSAPTHKAKKVIQRTTGRPSQTIQSLLGLAPFIELENFDPNKPQFKQKSDPRIGEYDLIIIDEASMLNKELANMLKKESEIHRVKLLFMGDEAQLPPVNETKSIVFSPEFSDERYLLDQVMRQADGNPLMQIYDQIRTDLKSPVDKFVHETIVNDQIEGCMFIDDKQMFADHIVSAFQSPEYKRDSDYCKILAWTNETVKGYNKLVRAAIFGEDAPPLRVGEILMAYSSVGYGDNVIIENSADYMVMEIVDWVDRLKNPKGDTVQLKMHRVLLKAIDVEVDFQDRYTITKHVNIVAPTPENYAIFVDIYDFFLSRAKAARSRIDRKNAWSAYYQFKDAHLLLHDIRRGQQLVVKKDLDYAYAITVHKSQGSTYTNVFVDEVDINLNQKRHEERNNLKYVALSRPSQLATVYTPVVEKKAIDPLHYRSTFIELLRTEQQKMREVIEETQEPSLIRIDKGLDQFLQRCEFVIEGKTVEEVKEKEKPKFNFRANLKNSNKR